MPSSQYILVTGDFILDRHIYKGERRHYGDRRSRGFKEVKELGGAALIYYLLQDLLKNQGQPDPARIMPWLAVRENTRKPDCDIADIPDDLQAYAFWRPSADKKGPGNIFWRGEEAMGFGGTCHCEKPFTWPPSQDPPGKPLIVVISDGGMGFREAKDRWPLSAFDRASWIALKTTHPIGRGALWDTLTRPAYRKKLVVITSAHDLRQSGALISKGLSWEETLETAARELQPGGTCAALARCRHLLIAFESDGGIWLDVQARAKGGRGDHAEPLLHLVYEASSIEGEHRQSCSGRSLGFLSCLAAAAAWKLAASGNQPDLEGALEGGLSAMRDLLISGHGRASEEPSGFPGTRLAGSIRETTCRYSRAAFPLAAAITPMTCPAGGAPAAGAGNCWSILHQALRAQGQGCPDPAYSFASLVVRRGPIALASIPHLRIGGLLSTDRREIESLRIIRRIILDYRKHSAGEKPLSIGVFGPPGAGKSFAVRQIARELVGDDSWMEFNLSQFSADTRDLIGAFHQIRDHVLAGKLPVAFFDEFDSRQYYWLQYLLAPMQDGRFQEGQITHPIGKCIFIFAGGTARTFASFGPPDINEEAYSRFCLAKGPDFKSRLDGYLNVLGPNRREIVSVNETAGRYQLDEDFCDIFFPIRRAFIIRSELRCPSDEKLQIDSGLLDALLRTGKYTHGSRSLSKILDPLRAARPGFLHRSLIPPANQLELHTGSSAFLAAHPWEEPESAVQPALAGADLEAVARAVHETWRELGRKEGWGTKERDVDFDRLNPFLQDSNRAAAGRMAETLALIDLKLDKGEQPERKNDAVHGKIEYHLEMLSEAEHDGWMNWHLDRGWKLGPKTAGQNSHPCLRPYMQLSDMERNKDRNSIRHYIDCAAKAGMRIVPGKGAGTKNTG